MSEENKPDESVHVGAGGEESSNFQPLIDTNQAILTLGDGSELPLKFGAPVVLEGGKRVN